MEQQHDLREKLDQIRERLSDPDFLNNRGLSYEVGIHVFCYDPSQEMLVKEAVKRLKDIRNARFRIVEFNLYELFLDILEEKKIADKLSEFELKKGKVALLAQLHNIVSPQEFLKAMQSRYRQHEKGRDVLVLSGVGEVHPFLRVHRLLDSMQALFDDIPVLLFYPGTFNGQSLSLFGEFTEGHYYRAFHLC